MEAVGMAPAIHHRCARWRVRRHRTLGAVQRGFTYDANGNLDQVTDALSRVTGQNVDPLNRLSRTLQDTAGLGAQTQDACDALDNPTQVTDPKGLNTTYTSTPPAAASTRKSPASRRRIPKRT